ncbi:MAG: sigma-70 family RNA polymerase sigma factor [Ruminococcus sp.]|nr:sigma-70 family RNA polymerase sigma factor [Ruminococcus sp.]
MTDSEYRSMMQKSAREAQNALFGEYFNYVYAIVYSKLRAVASREDIDECVSDAFADVFFHCGSERTREGELKGIIGTIASRRAIDRFHSISAKAGRNVPLDEAAELADSTDLAENAEKAELAAGLLAAVKSLGEPDSTIIIQKYYGNMSSKEIAETVSMSPAAVRVRCGRALKRLKKLLSGDNNILKEVEI